LSLIRNYHSPLTRNYHARNLLYWKISLRSISHRENSKISLRSTYIRFSSPKIVGCCSPKKKKDSGGVAEPTNQPESPVDFTDIAPSGNTVAKTASGDNTVANTAGGNNTSGNNTNSNTADSANQKVTKEVTKLASPNPGPTSPKTNQSTSPSQNTETKPSAKMGEDTAVTKEPTVHIGACRKQNKFGEICLCPGDPLRAK
jgi:hypothetical protein